jgi:hypothetical protein
MKTLLAAIVLAFCAASARADPVINDQKAAKQLLGKHALTLQWIGTGGLKDAGTAEVKQANGEWRLTGRNDAKEGFVSLDGVVTGIDKTTFTFKGKIVTRVEFIFDGKECAREGEYTFERKGARKYWRMYPVESPCGTATDSAADYIDIFLR